MFGKNPKRPPENGDGSTLKVVEIFPTLQGEGPFVGQPAVFVRLGGCNLACNFCDTEFEAFEEIALKKIITSILRHTRACREYPDTSMNPRHNAEDDGGWRNRDLVVITGGEPLRQNIAPLCDALLAKGLRVQIETNGTLWRELPEGVSIVCSPKVTDGRYHPLRTDLLARVDALKFIVSADAGDYHAVGEVGQAGTAIPIYVQPMDEYDPTRNAANMAYALTLAQTYGFRLSMQMHKVWGIA